MKNAWIRLSSLWLAALLLALPACAREEDETRAYYRTSGGEEVEVELDDDVADEAEELREDADDLGDEIEDEIIEDADGPFE